MSNTLKLSVIRPRPAAKPAEDTPLAFYPQKSPRVARGSSRRRPIRHCPRCLAAFRKGEQVCLIDGSPLMTMTADPFIGKVLDDRYRVLDRLGQGGMGRVYRVRHLRLDHDFAVKVLFGDLLTDQASRGRFAREGQAIARMRHANIISVVDISETADGVPYLIMELAHGPLLSNLMATEGPFSHQRTMALARQLCLGLGHAHSRGIMHRDFKGENIIIGYQDGREIPKIVDFGFARPALPSPDYVTLTDAGVALGTPVTMAPEQAIGDKDIDHRADLFSLGVVIYQMLAGTLPFDGEPIDIACKYLHARIPTITERTGRPIDPGLEAIVMRLLQRRPEDRFQSADDVVRHLDALNDVPLLDFEPTLEDPLAGLISEELSVVEEQTTEIVARLAPPEPKRSVRARTAALIAAGAVAVGALIASAAFLL